jgi:Rps23 Pro-64 3,4-dihydroxylase Tpa1-like proline 4-hydroxylase
MIELTDAERAEVSALWLKALGLTGAYTIYQAGMRAGIERKEKMKMSKIDNLSDQIEEAVEKEIVERFKQFADGPVGWIEIEDDDLQIVISTNVEFEDDDGKIDIIVAKRSLRELLQQHAEDAAPQLRSILLKLINEELEEINPPA